MTSSERNKRRKPNRHPKYRATMERRAVKRKAEAEYLLSRAGIKGGYIPRGTGLGSNGGRERTKDVVSSVPRERPNRYVPMTENEAAGFLAANGWVCHYLTDGGLWSREHWAREPRCSDDRAYYSTRKAIKIQRSFTQ